MVFGRKRVFAPRLIVAYPESKLQLGGASGLRIENMGLSWKREVVGLDPQQKEFRVGRYYEGHDNHLVFPYHIGSRVLERRHFAIRFEPQNKQFFVEDLGSEHGTFVNGVRVKNPVQLRHGDSITLKFTREEPDFCFVLDENGKLEAKLKDSKEIFRHAASKEH